MHQSLSTTTTTTAIAAAPTETASLTLPLPEDFQLINDTKDFNKSLYNTSSSIMSITNIHDRVNGNGNGSQQNLNRSALDAMLQMDDIFGNSFTSSVNDHQHHALLNINSNINGNMNINTSGKVNVVTSNSSVHSNRSGSVQTAPSNTPPMDNMSVSTDTASINSVQVNRGNNIDTNINGMYYSNNGNNHNQGKVQGHVNTNGRSDGNANGAANGNIHMSVYVDNSAKDDKNNGSVSASLSSGSNGNGNSGVTSTEVPVKYKICMGSLSNSFTITLLVPIPTKNNNNSSFNNTTASPFQKVGSPDNSKEGAQAQQAFALRIPLAYLLQSHQQQEASNAESAIDPSATPSSLPSWLDRTVLRNRINDGGRAIGLEPTFAFQAAVAVEETASKLPQWLCPLQSVATSTSAATIEAVTVEVVLSEGIVTLVASATNPNIETGTCNLNNGPNSASSATTMSGLASSLGSGYVNRNGGGVISHPSNSNSPAHTPPLPHVDNKSGYSPSKMCTLAVGQSQGGNQVAASPSNRLGLGSGGGNGGTGVLSSSSSPKYNVLNERGVELLATAPSFPPPGMGPSRPSSNNSNGSGSPIGHPNGIIHVNGSNNSNAHTEDENAGSFQVFRSSSENPMSRELYFNNVDHGNMNGNSNHVNINKHSDSNVCNTSNGNDVFNSQLLGSSFGSWTSYHQQHQRPTGLSSSFQGPSSTASMRNSFGMSSSRTTGASANVNNNNNIIGRGMHNGNDIKNTMYLSSSFPSYNYGDVIMREQQLNNNHRSVFFENGNNSNNNAINVDRTNMNMNHNGVSNNRPNPSIIIGPLLNMGFSKLECEVAAVAIHRHQSHENMNNGSSLGNMLANHHNQNQRANYHDNNNNFRRGLVDDTSLNDISRNLNKNQQECDDGVVNAMNNMSLVRNSNLGNNNHHHIINGSSTSDVNRHHHHQSAHQGNMQESLANNSSSSVWGNAGKMKMIKTPTNNFEGSVDTDDGTIDSADKVAMNHMANIQMGGPGNISHSLMQQKQQPQQQEEKMIRVLDIPPDLNAFVFHCNSQTREECLERGLFGCPSGGQYGPHSKAKKGDLLFLADFSAWTVTGIFTAKSDAGLNLEKGAWGGRFPWQIKVNAWNELRTVHIDKINEIIGLASGSKLNMLTKDQLMQLVTSTEFGPNVPDHLFKMKRKVSI